MTGRQRRSSSADQRPAARRCSAYDLAMSRALEDATARILVLLAVMVGAVLAIVLPALLITAADAPSTAVTVLTLALAALLVLAMVLWVSPAGCSRAPARLGGDGPPPVLSGRVTDPVHHPLRPRAPGLA